MDKLKKILKRIFVFHPLIAIIIALLGSSFLTIIFIFRLAKTWVGVLSYIFSVYALIVLIASLSFNWKKFVQWYETKPIKGYVDKYRKNYSIRGTVSMCFVILVAIGNVVFRLFEAFHYRSLWYFSIASYYGALFVLNAIILIAYIKIKKIPNQTEREEKELEVSRIIGYLMTILAFAMEGMLIEMIVFGHSYQRRGIYIWFSAAYVIYALIVAIKNIVTFKKSGSELLITAKLVRMAEALMALVALQATLIYSFGNPEDRALRRSLMSANGNLVTILIIAMTIYLIVANTKKLKKLRSKESDEKREDKTT